MIPVKDYIERIDKSLERIKNLPVNKKLEAKLAKDFFDELKEQLSKSPDGYIPENENGWKGSSIEQIPIWESVLNAIN